MKEYNIQRLLHHPAEGKKCYSLLASSLVITLPVIALFFFTQREFIEGIGFSGSKV